MGHEIALGQHPVMQRFDDRYRHFLTYSPTILIAHVPRLAFNLVQTANRVQGLFGQLTFVRCIQVVLRTDQADTQDGIM